MNHTVSWLKYTRQNSLLGLFANNDFCEFVKVIEMIFTSMVDGQTDGQKKRTRLFF